MTLSPRKLAFSVATACFTLVLGAASAHAATHHHHKRHHTTHHHSRHHHHAKSDAAIRIVQQHLANLGYYHGKVDGITGPKTRAAIKQFQKEHGLKADGIAGPKTRRALEAADVPPPPVAQPPMQEPAPVPPPPSNQPVSQDYQAPLNGTKHLDTRFAQLDVNETGDAGNRMYGVNLNGQPILQINGQPSVIGISPVYNLDKEDAVVFTSYAPGDPVCTYQNHVLVLTGTGTKMLDLQNCTRSFTASVKNGMLFIVFPEYEDNRDVGQTWRLEGLDLERL